MIVNDLNKFESAIKKPQLWGVDIETSSLDPWDKNSLVLSIAFANAEETFGFLIDHPKDRETSHETLSQRIHLIQKLFENPEQTLVGHNWLQFDNIFWRAYYGVEIYAKEIDTRVLHSLVNENEENSLDFLAKKYTSLKKNEEDLNRKKLITYDPMQVLHYNMSDARISYEVYEPIMKDLKGQEKLVKFVLDVSKILADMSVRGTKVDEAWVNKQTQEIEKELRAKKEGLKYVIGDVNINSPKQLGKLLYETMGLPVLVRSFKTGEPSTGKDAILNLRYGVKLSPWQNRTLNEILEVRNLQKLKSTYLLPFKTKHTKSDGRLHTKFNIGKGNLQKITTGTVTGRLSSSNPNLQNMPRDNRLRGVIIPSKEMLLFDADYSQLELRVLQYFSSDAVMLEAFLKGKDLHTIMAAKTHNREYEDVVKLLESENVEIRNKWKEFRTQAKRTNFGIPYGIGFHKLRLQIWDVDVPIDLEETKKLVRNWHVAFPQASKKLEDWKKEAAQTGRVLNPIGRIRHLEGANFQTKEGHRLLRQAVNFPIQSFASDITLIALKLIDQFFKEKGGGHLLLTVHDSIEGEFFKNYWKPEEIKKELKHLMEDGVNKFLYDNWGLPPVPLDTEIKILDRWSL